MSNTKVCGKNLKQNKGACTNANLDQHQKYRSMHEDLLYNQGIDNRDLIRNNEISKVSKAKNDNLYIKNFEFREDSKKYYKHQKIDVDADKYNLGYMEKYNGLDFGKLNINFISSAKNKESPQPNKDSNNSKRARPTTAYNGYKKLARAKTKGPGDEDFNGYFKKMVRDKTKGPDDEDFRDEKKTVSGYGKKEIRIARRQSEDFTKGLKIVERIGQYHDFETYRTKYSQNQQIYMKNSEISANSHTREGPTNIRRNSQRFQQKPSTSDLDKKFLETRFDNKQKNQQALQLQQKHQQIILKDLDKLCNNICSNVSTQQTSKKEPISNTNLMSNSKNIENPEFVIDIRGSLEKQIDTNLGNLLVDENFNTSNVNNNRKLISRNKNKPRIQTSTTQSLYIQTRGNTSNEFTDFLQELDSNIKYSHPNQTHDKTVILDSTLQGLSNGGSPLLKNGHFNKTYDCIDNNPITGSSINFIDSENSQ